ncbi:MAG: trehalose-6-phosphate synthase [Vicinamibacterales bacterium]
MPQLPKLLSSVRSRSDELARIASATLTGIGAAAASVARSGRDGALTYLRATNPELDFESDDDSGFFHQAQPWTATRLKEVLHQQLKGERVIVVANREPRIHDFTADGSIRERHPASGLVTALEPVMRACSGVWIAHGSGSADRESSDRHGRVQVQAGDASYLLRRVWLTEEEERGYYYGFSNEALWPLCHLAHAHPIFRRDDWIQYERINRRFADAVAAEAEGDDPIVLVQDYHFALVPRMLRKRFPRATILTFWHIPWPNAESFAICPYHEALLDGLLGSSIIGFQTAQHGHNFLDSVDRSIEARVERQDMAIVLHGRTTLVRPYPISIEWPNPWSAAAPDAETCRSGVRAELGLEPSTRVVVSVDRLDYTKGIEERLRTFERALERRVPPADPLAFVLVGAPSRTRIERYREFGDRVRTEVERINRRFGGPARIILCDRHCEPPEVFRLYRAADVCYVSSLHDGMNLVAKEFVSARDDGQGVLLLSQFAGASRELTEAIIVNPYDVESVAEALEAALAMPAAQQRDRMRAMRSHVAEHNVYRWAGRMLVDATRLRHRERLHGRLTDHPRRLKVKPNVLPAGVATTI